MKGCYFFSYQNPLPYRVAIQGCHTGLPCKGRTKNRLCETKAIVFMLMWLLFYLNHTIKPHCLLCFRMYELPMLKRIIAILYGKLGAVV